MIRIHAKSGAAVHAVLLLLAAAALTGCKSTENRLLGESGMRVEDPSFFPSDDYLRMGKVYFRNGNYGMAEQSFRKAVEVTPKDAEAWLGLAASYDNLRRFDLADKAYEKVLQLASQNATILNNAGYSQMLRGDLASARRFFLRAYELEPGNPYIANNLELLAESEKTVKRAAL